MIRKLNFILITIFYAQTNGGDDIGIDWHEWVTADEIVSSPLEIGGFSDLSWSSRAAWNSLANSSTGTPRPPIFLLPGIASSRLVNWREKRCRRGSPIKARDVVWVNVGKLIESTAGSWIMGDTTCWYLSLSQSSLFQVFLCKFYQR